MEITLFKVPFIESLNKARKSSGRSKLHSFSVTLESRFVVKTVRSQLDSLVIDYKTVALI